MAWKELSKDQKQKFILLILGVVMVVIAAKVLVLDGLTQDAEMTGGATESIATRLADYKNRLKPAGPALARQLLETREKMVQLTETHLPRRGGEFSWAGQQIFLLQQKLGLEIGKDDVGTLTREASSGGPLHKDSVFVPYVMKTSFSGSFAEMVGFVHAMERDYPFVAITRLTVNPSANPDKHAIEAILQWPVWADPKDYSAIQDALAGKKPEPGAKP